MSRVAALGSIMAPLKATVVVLLGVTTGALRGTVVLLTTKLVALRAMRAVTKDIS